jgi:hypothetical protein
MGLHVAGAGGGLCRVGARWRQCVGRLLRTESRKTVRKKLKNDCKRWMDGERRIYVLGKVPLVIFD